MGSILLHLQRSESDTIVELFPRAVGMSDKWPSAYNASEKRKSGYIPVITYLIEVDLPWDAMGVTYLATYFTK